MVELPTGLSLLIRLMRCAIPLVAALTLAGPAFLWSDLELLRRSAPGMVGGLQLSEMWIDERARWLGALAMTPELAATVLALWSLWMLFSQYALAQFFVPKTQTYLRRFAWALLSVSVLTQIEPTLLGLAFTAGMPPGQHQLTVGVSTAAFLQIVASAAFLAIAVVMSEASRIAEENGQFV